MLTLEQKIEVFHFYSLKESHISNERINFEYPASRMRGKVIVRELAPTGNGYVLGKYMSLATINKYQYKVDPRGWISIKNFSKDDLMLVIEEAMKSMS